MNISTVATLIDALKKFFHYEQWYIDIVETSSDSNRFTVSVRKRYMSATITVSTTAYSGDEEQFYEDVLHEFAHIVLADYDLISDLAESLALSPRETNLLKIAFRDSDEASTVKVTQTWLRVAPSYIKTYKGLAEYIIERSREGHGRSPEASAAP